MHISGLFSTPWYRRLATRHVVTSRRFREFHTLPQIISTCPKQRMGQGHVQLRRHLNKNNTSEKPRDSSFPTDGHKAILNKINNKSKTKRKWTNIDIRINYNRITALERSVINYRGGGAFSTIQVQLLKLTQAYCVNLRYVNPVLYWSGSLGRFTYWVTTQVHLHIIPCILVKFYVAISLKLLYIFQWNFQYWFEMWFSLEKESIIKTMIAHVKGDIIDWNVRILNAFS